MRRTEQVPGIGFVPLPEGEARTKNFTVRMSPAEVRAIREAAARAKADVPGWTREKLLRGLTLPK